MNKKKKFWRYENWMVMILMCTFGFVMFDRFAIATLAPFMGDIGMGPEKLGFVMSAFALSWGVAGYIGAAIADITANKKRVLWISVLCFSICSFLTGLAQNFAMLVGIRLLMGLFEGPVMPVQQAFTLAQSTPSRRGFNMGLVTTTSVGLISSLLGPIILVALYKTIGWRPTFFMTLIPGLIIAFLIYKVLKEPDMTKVEGSVSKADKISFRDSLTILKNRNVITSLFYSVFIITWYVSMLTFTPLYLMNVKLAALTASDPDAAATIMSLIMAAFGAGAIIWGMVVPAWSDKIGRKPMTILFSLLAAVIAPIGFIYFDSPWALAACAFFGWCGTGVFPLYLVAIPGESVDPKYATSAIGAVQLAGEILGGVIGVAIAGMLGGKFGLDASLIFSACCMGVAFLVAFGYYESAPLVVAKRKAASH
ncbi:MAG: MFS transporter [Tannerella sp.]|jgi:predicted MFS family arabinose efflux permease|nr:MFS transporter [Tannerella sp.]